MDAVTHALELRNLVYGAESGRFWEEHSDYFKPEERVDRVLLDNLMESHRLLRVAGLSADEAQALLVQAMFVAYLEDREIIGADYFPGEPNVRTGNFETLLQSGDVESLESLFETLRADFNGDLFVAPCSFESNDHGPRLQASHLAILARFRSGREEMYGPDGQYRLWRYDFKYIPIELISAVHDRFLGERGPERHAEGAYYTPMFLADTVVAHVWDRLLPAIRDSGCFSIRRAAPASSWCACSSACASTAARLVTTERFPGTTCATSWRGCRAGTWTAAQSAWPCSRCTSRCSKRSLRGNIRTLMQRGRVLPVLHGNLRENGVVAFLRPAMGFLHNHAGHAVHARKRLMREARVFSVVNFADMRFQLFDGPVRPAALLLLGPPAGGAAYRFDYLTPKADLNLRSKRLITIGSADKCRLDSRMVDTDPSVFKKRLWMSEPEARLFNYLAQFPNLCDLVVEFGTLSRRKESTENRWVVGQGFQPANIERLQRAAAEHLYSGVVATTPHLPIDEFRILARTGEGLILSQDRDVYLAYECKRLNVVREDGKRSLAREYVMDGLSRFITRQYAENLPVGCMLGYVVDGDLKSAASSVRAKIVECCQDVALIREPRDDVAIGEATRFYSRHRRGANGGEIEVRHARLPC